MPKHTVAQGDTISSIAAKYGFADWKTIFEDPANAELRKKRGSPQFLFPGDEVVVPDPKPKRIDVETGVRYRFKVHKPRAKFRMRLALEGGHPHANLKYQLKVKDKTFDGRTGADGLIEHEVAPDATEGTLTVWFGADSDPPTAYNVKLGHMDPAREVSGAKGRLAQMGFYSGPVDGNLDEAAQTALKDFQDHAGLEPTGQLDDATVEALVRMHDQA